MQAGLLLSRFGVVCWAKLCLAMHCYWYYRSIVDIAAGTAGLVFMPLTQPYLQEWGEEGGDDWQSKCPQVRPEPL